MAVFEYLHVVAGIGGSASAGQLLLPRCRVIWFFAHNGIKMSACGSGKRISPGLSPQPWRNLHFLTAGGTDAAYLRHWIMGACSCCPVRLAAHAGSACACTACSVLRSRSLLAE